MDGTATMTESSLRGQVYGFLAFGYHYPPDREQAPRLAASERAARELGLGNLGDAFGELARLVRGAAQDLLRQDFDDLFMVPGPRYVTPYESVYRDPPIEANARVAPRTYGPSTQAILAYYSRIGLQITKGYVELPDYVGLEMACMEYLCTREAECAAAGRDPEAENVRALERRFLREHLGAWVAPLAARIREKAGTEYYRTLAGVTADWVRRDAELIAADPDPPPSEKRHET
ncbi:MAG: molecular chaperone TorD family protein [Planctomycetes bacterium]|nr:molecular chaperone TorD family protein [Planctomycetota bacterium]